MNDKTQCQLCHATVELVLIQTPHAARAWRMFDCPHCLKTNFMLLTAQILAAIRGSDLVASTSGTGALDAPQPTPGRAN